MGAGIVECDVTFTKDRQLVCRHSQCDLHTTTNILAIPELAAKCSSPPDFASDAPFANVQCCTSDITVAEFKSLCGKMDASNPDAKTVEEYLGGTADFRTDLYASCGTVLTHAESIELFDDLGVGMTPELKTPSVPMPYEGDYTQEAFAQQMIDEYEIAGVSPRRVWAQSFLLDDVLYWIRNEPAFGRQAVYLDARVDDPSFDRGFENVYASMQELGERGVNIVAPPMWALLRLDADGNIVPSEYALAAKGSGRDIITWTFERSGLLSEAQGPPPTYYYQQVAGAIDNDGDKYEALDVLARDIGILGIFTDWAATVTYYANCVGLR
jgi:glycerophosphoryl diester phosphodiesterase